MTIHAAFHSDGAVWLFLDRDAAERHADRVRHGHNRPPRPVVKSGVISWEAET